MFKKNKNEKEMAIEKISKNDSFVLSTGGTIVAVGSGIDVMSDVAYLFVNLYKCLPQKMKIDILSAIITKFKDEEEISDESDKLARKVLDEIEKLK